MYSNIYQIFSNANSKLFIMPRPRGNDWLEFEIRNLKANNINVVVSLLEKHEIIELGLINENIYCKKNNIVFKNFPIKDRKTPININSYTDFINYLYVEFDSGKNIAIHCRMGIGRSSMVAASILQFYNYSIIESFSLISKIRKMKVPDTNEQLNWLLKLYS